MSGPLETDAYKLAQEYVRLGGKRHAVLDDNIVETRKWESENPEAEAFWNEHIKPLGKDRLSEVESHLPSINAT